MPFIAAIIAGVQAIGAYIAGMSFWAKVALNLAISFAASKLLAPRISQPEDQGSRQQLPPATENKVPVIYGQAYMQGIITHAEISNSNKTMHYVMVLSETTHTGTWTCDEVYWNDELLSMTGSKVLSGSKEVDGAIETNNNYNSPVKGSTEGNLYISVYAGNGSSANCILGDAVNAWDLVPNWDSTYRMEGLVFAVVKVNYNADKGFQGLAPVTFKLNNSLNNPALVWKDYCTSKRYGAGLTEADLDSNVWDSGDPDSWVSVCDETYTYTDNEENTTTQSRYQINGVLDTNRSVKDNIDKILSAGSAWMTFNTAEGKWKIIQKRAMDPVMVLGNDQITTAINISSTSLNDLYNKVEVEFPSRLQRDQNDYVRFALLDSLRHPNEPDNQLRMRLDLVNNNIQAEQIANIELRQSRDDLVVTFNTTYEGLQLQAGDVIGIENDVYGWNSINGFDQGKLFRITRIRELEDDQGGLHAEIVALEYNEDVYTDEDISEFTPSPNFNISGAGTSARLPAPSKPEVIDVDDNSTVPSFTVETVTAATGGPYDRIDLYISEDGIDYTYLTTKKTTPENGLFGQSESITFKITGLPTGTYNFKTLAGFQSSNSAFSLASDELAWSPVIIADPDPGSVAANLDWFPNPLVIPTDADGNNPVIGQNVYLRLLLGTATVDISNETTDGAMANDSWRVVSTTATGLTVGTRTDDLTNNRAQWTVTDSTSSSATLAVAVHYKDGTGTIIDLGTTILSVAQLRNGTDGVNAKNLRLLATGQSFTRPKGSSDSSTGAYIPGNILFTALTSNIVESVSFSAINQLGQPVTLTGSGYTRTLTNTNFGDTNLVTVTASVTSDGTTYEDKITVTRLREGDNGDPGINAFLTNETHGVPTNTAGNIGSDADSDGIIDSLEAANSFMKIYEGTQDVTDLWTFNNTEGEGKQTLDCSATITTTGLNKGKVQVTDLTGDTGLVTITASRSGYSDVSKTFTVVKQRQGSSGADGVSAITLSMLSTASAFMRKINTTDQGVTNYRPTTITLYPRLTGMSPQPQINWYVAAINPDGSLGTEYLWQTLSGSTAVNFTPQNFVSFAQGKTNGTSNDGTSAVANAVRIRATTTYQGNTYQDFTTVYKLIEGDSGTTMILSNESHTLSATTAGVVTSYLGASTQVRIFAGIQDDTANWTFSLVPGTGITATASGSPNGSVVTVTNLADGIDSSYIDITATKGSTSITRRFTLTKTKQGVTGTTGPTGPQGPQGTDARLVYLSATGQSITYNRQGNLNPSDQTITFTANLQNLTGTAAFTCIVYNNSNAQISTITLGGSGNVRTLTGSQFNSIAGAAYVIVSATLSGLTDTMTVVKLSEGADGVTPVVGYLTNESAQVPADYLGNVASYTAASGNFKVFNGLSDVTNSATYSVVSQVGATGSAITSGGAYSIGSMTADVATITFRASFGGVSIDKILTVTKSRAGIPGTNAELVYITSTAQNFIFNSSGVAQPTSQVISFTANLKNIVGTVTWAATAYDSSGNAIGSLSLGGTGNSRTLTVGSFGSAQYAIISATIGSLTDIVSIVRLQQGINGVTPVVGYLTNESALLAATSEGVVIDYAPAQGQFKVFSGVTDVTNSTTFSIVSASGISATINNVGAYNVSNITQDAATVTLRAVYAGTTIDKVLSVNKSRAGTAGLNASLVYLSASALSFTYDGSGTASPATQTINLIANVQNLAGTATWTATGYNAQGTSTGSLVLGGSGNARTLTNTQFGSNAYAIITATIGAFSDTVTIVRLQQGLNGQNAVTGYLTNENITFAADKDGVVPSFALGTGTFKVFNGLTDVTAITTFSKAQSDTNCTTTINSTGNYAVTAMSADQAQATFRASYGGVTIDKILTLSKSRAGVGVTGPAGPQGTDGTKNVTISLYQWSPTQPAAPNSVSAYDWSTGYLTYSGIGWTPSAPANPGTPGIRLWVVSKTISAPASQTTTSNISWTGSPIYAVGGNGFDGDKGDTGAPGASGTKTIVVTCYQWAVSIPQTPVSAQTYYWTSSQYNIPAGWQYNTQNPQPGNTLWQARVVITDTAAATQTSFNWNTASITAVGYAGNNGANGSAGPAGSQGASYRVCYSKTNLTGLGAIPATITTTGSTSFPPNSSWGTGTVWQNQPQQIVAGEQVWQSDGIYDPATNNTIWYAPYLSTLKVGALSAITANMGSITAGQMNINNNFIIDSSGNATIKGNADISGTVSASKFIMRDTLGAASNQVFDPTSGQVLRNNPHLSLYYNYVLNVGNTVFTDPSLTFHGPNDHSSVSLNRRLPRIGTAESSSIKLLVSINARVDHWMLPVVRLTSGTATETYYPSTGGTQTISYDSTWKPLGGTYLYNGYYPASFAGITSYEGGYQQVFLQYVMNLNSFNNDSRLQFGLALTGRDDGVANIVGGVPSYIDGPTSGTASSVLQVKGPHVYNLQYTVVVLS